MKSTCSFAIFPLLAGAMLLLLSGCGPSPAGDPEAELDEEQALHQAGRQRSRSCMGCHGPQGISRVQSYPSLAGKPQAYLEEQLHAYRRGEGDPMMSSVARNLSDEDIVALSHYYASLPGPDSSN